VKAEDLRNLALLIAGIILGLISPIILSLIISRLDIYLQLIVLFSLALASVFLILVGLGFPQRKHHEYVLKNRWRKTLKLGILNDMGWDIDNKDIYSWTDVEPKDWKNAVGRFADSSGVDVKVEFIDVNKKFENYVAILNPYGGVYPETNLKTLNTLDKIINYVREGGLFINVADIPAYWAYNSDLKRRLDIAEAIYSISPSGADLQIISTRPFELVPLAKTLGLRIFGSNEGITQSLSKILGKNAVSVTAKRAVIVESNVESCLDMVQGEYYDGKQHNVSSLFFVKYGDGDFLLSLIWINDENHDQKKKKAIRDSISKLILDKLASKISA